jgi:hypothetical protein
MIEEVEREDEFFCAADDDGSLNLKKIPLCTLQGDAQKPYQSLSTCQKYQLHLKIRTEMCAYGLLILM